MKQNLSVIIPVFKEAARIRRCIEESLSFFRHNPLIHEFELLFVVDDSGDGSLDIIKEYIHNKEIHFFLNDNRLQKGGSVKKGMLAARYNILLYYDADLSTPLTEVNECIELIQRYDIVIGSRGVEGAQVKKNMFKTFLSNGFSLLKLLILGLRFRDTQCGFKMFRRSTLPIFEKQRIVSSCFDVELLYIAQKNGFSIVEKPVIWVDSSYSNFFMHIVIISFLKELIEIRWNAFKGYYFMN
ncbi:MAG: glycosyltransferase [Candidatus Woesearchaeota archaeon]|jgi:dolichyl-phosphate beta-glucosyltransferase